MSRCPPRSCSGCQDELCQEWITRKAESKKDRCLLGPLPEVDHDSEDDSGLSITDPEDEPISIKDGDQIFSTGLLLTPSIEIRASSMISQRLAEVIQANLEALTPVLDYLKEFTSIFSKKPFDVLPEPTLWLENGVTLTTKRSKHILGSHI